MDHENPLDGVIDRSLNYGRHHIDHFLAVANHDSPKVFLDIGAGWGTDLLLARSHNPSAQLHAIELSAEYKKGLHQKGITVHSLNIERDVFPFADESVDVLIANQILEHVKEIFWIFHESTRVLRVGGTFIIGVPNLASLHNRLLLAVGQQPTCLQNHSAHVRGFTKSDILRFLSVCFPRGFHLRKFGGSNFYPFPGFIAKPLAVILPNLAWGIFLMFRKDRAYTKEFLVHPTAHRLETNFHLGNE